MFSIYETTRQGEQTRSRLLHHISPGEELSREALAARAGLTYEQVRRQTKNLCIDGVLKSRIEDGKRFYQLRLPKTFVSTFIVAALVSWSVPLMPTNLGTENDDRTATTQPYATSAQDFSLGT